MKKTYLVEKDGALVEVTLKEWHDIIQKNRELPSEQKRHFILDCIEEGNEWDCMYIEVPQDVHREWNRGHTASQRNGKEKKKFKHLPLDAISSFVSEPGFLEDDIVFKAEIRQLQDRLQRWNPWAVDCLQIYLAGNKQKCVAMLMKKYGLPKRTAQEYKSRFEKFMKKILK